MIIELGHFALILALLLSVLQATLPFVGAEKNKQAWMMMGRQAAQSVFWLVSIAFLALLHAYALSDFSVLNVALNSHTLKPVAYKLSAAWGNHEGSMVLWLWLMSFWTVLVVQRTQKLPITFQARVVSVQGLLSAGFAGFILLTSNPFLRLSPPAPEGLDLNPVLQDILLIIHPPFLYVGYVGFSVVFSFAVAGLIEGKIDSAWARAARAWVLWPWVFLTTGIALGSFWAYYELGWGGFWFWDPVENVSLLPWLSATALFHSMIVLEKRNSLPGWTVLLALLTFSLCLLGTFLVRSGLLTSVHAFAADPARGVFLLGIISVFVGSAFYLFARRAPQVRTGAPFGWLSRESALLLNNLFLMSFLTTVLLGTIYPVLLAAFDAASISVGTPYYVAVLLPMLLPFAFLMGAASALSWRRSALEKIKKLRFPAIVTCAGLFMLGVSPLEINATIIIGFGAGFWIIAAMMHDISGKKLKALPLSYVAMVVGHIGFAVLIMGATAATQWKSEETLWMKRGQHTTIADQRVLMLGTEAALGPNYNIDRVILSVEKTLQPGDFFFLMPEKRWYPVQERETSETSLAVRGFDVLYAVLGDRDVVVSDRWVVRLYHHPLVLWIFIGAALIALAGILAGVSRREAQDA